MSSGRSARKSVSFASGPSELAPRRGGARWRGGDDPVGESDDIVQPDQGLIPQGTLNPTTSSVVRNMVASAFKNVLDSKNVQPVAETEEDFDGLMAQAEAMVSGLEAEAEAQSMDQTNIQQQASQAIDSADASVLPALQRVASLVQQGQDPLAGTTSGIQSAQSTDSLAGQSTLGLANSINNMAPQRLQSADSLAGQSTLGLMNSIDNANPQRLQSEDSLAGQSTLGLANSIDNSAPQRLQSADSLAGQSTLGLMNSIDNANPQRLQSTDSLAGQSTLGLMNSIDNAGPQRLSSSESLAGQSTLGLMQSIDNAAVQRSLSRLATQSSSDLTKSVSAALLEWVKQQDAGGAKVDPSKVNIEEGKRMLSKIQTMLPTRPSAQDVYNAVANVPSFDGDINKVASMQLALEGQSGTTASGSPGMVLGTSAYYVDFANKLKEGTNLQPFSVQRTFANAAVEHGVSPSSAPTYTEQMQALPADAKVYLDNVTTMPMEKNGQVMHMLDTAEGHATASCTPQQILTHILLSPQGIAYDTFMETDTTNIKVNKSVVVKGKSTYVLTSDPSRVAVYEDREGAEGTEFLRSTDRMPADMKTGGKDGKEWKWQKPKPTDFKNRKPPRFKFLAEHDPAIVSGGGRWQPGMISKGMSSAARSLGAKFGDYGERENADDYLHSAQLFGRFIWETPGASP